MQSKRLKFIGPSRNSYCSYPAGEIRGRNITLGGDQRRVLATFTQKGIEALKSGGDVPFDELEYFRFNTMLMVLPGDTRITLGV